MKRAAVFLVITLIARGRAFAASSDLLDWLTAVRGSAAPLAVDPVLMETAQSYAEVLASVGRISHTGPDGSDALTRYLRRGGTCARVAEIIGAGPDLAEIEAAWTASESHRSAIVRRYWTDVGWGRTKTATGEIRVVLFARRLVAGLAVDRAGGRWTVSGVLHAPDADRPVIVSGVVRIDAAEWDPRDGRFLFRASDAFWSGYVRLGYLKKDGDFEITDVLTSPRGTGYR
jgi:hypothetical protein